MRAVVNLAIGSGIGAVVGVYVVAPIMEATMPMWLPYFLRGLSRVTIVLLRMLDAVGGM